MRKYNFYFSLIFCCGLFFLNQGFPGEKNSTPHFFVGELGQKWDLGSDHLPIGTSINGRYFVSWNILNKDYLHWIETNSQGLKESAIMKNHRPLEQKKSLTIRENIIANEIESMALHGTHPRSLFALQETHQDVFDELRSRLPPSFSFVTTFPQDISHGDVFIYDSIVFDFVDLISSRYSSSNNTWMILKLKDRDSDIPYTFIQSHVPGGEKSKAFRLELARACLDYLDPQGITLVLGDQNRSPDYFYQDLMEISKEKGRKNHPFSILQIPYPTHVNTLMEASWIDNLFLADPLGQAQEVNVSSSEKEYFEELSSVLALLWQNFPLQALVKSAEQALPDHEKVKDQFDKLLNHWRIYYLLNEGFDLEGLLKAIIYAATQHEGQFRGDAVTPYIFHPLQVCYNLWERGEIRNPNILIAALLHDTLEDTDAAADEIASLFGERVLSIVEEVTNDPYLDSKENKKRQIKHAPHMSQDARLVKLSDRFTNICDLKNSPPLWSEEKIREYYEWGRKLLKALQGTNLNLEKALNEAVS